jgi:hypothetical protein
MSHRVLCLRPEADFLRVGAPAPALEVAYHGPADAAVTELIHRVTLVIPAVGPKLAPDLFERSSSSCQVTVPASIGSIKRR